MQTERSLFARLRLERWVVVLFSSLAIVVLTPWQGTERLDNQVYDAFMLIDGKPARDDIVIVAIDDDTLDQLGPWPWSRVRLADLITAIGRARPASLGVNVLLAGNHGKQEDQRLASAIAGAGCPVYLSVAIANTGPDAAERARALLPPPVIRNAASGLGQTSFPVDSDGLVRRAYAELPAQGTSWPSMAALLAGTTEKSQAVAARPWLIPFASSHFATIPAWQLLADPGVAQQLTNRRVLLGVTATGIDATLPTPLSGADGYLSGTQIEAHFLAAVLDNNVRKPMSRTTTMLASLVLAWLTFGLSNWVKPSQAVTFTLAAITAYLVADLLALATFNLWFAPTAGICGFILAQSLWAWRRTNAIMAFMVREIAQYQDSSRTPPPRSTLSDPLIGQAEVLARTLKSARIAHQFIVDTINHLPAAVLVVELDGQVSLANEIARRLFTGRTFEGPNACNLADLLKDFVLDEPSARWAVGGSQAADDERQIAVNGPDGSHFELHLGLVRTPTGALQAWIVQLTDITMIRTATQQREEVMTLLTHDLRSPLAAIVATVTQSTPEGADASLRTASRFALRALKMADDYVLFSKASASQFYLEPASCRLLLEDAIEEVVPQARAAGLHIRLGGSTAPWLVLGDLSLLHRCLINLIGNAVQHGGHGTRIYCSVRNLELSGQRMVEISIHDWGPGIPPGAVSTIFEPFNQGHGAASRQGAGLGLALVEKVVRGHGGSIEYERLGERCTCFRMRLPAIDEVEASLDEDWEAEQPLAPKGTIHD